MVTIFTWLVGNRKLLFYGGIVIAILFAIRSVVAHFENITELEKENQLQKIQLETNAKALENLRNQIIEVNRLNDEVDNTRVVLDNSAEEFNNSVTIILSNDEVTEAQINELNNKRVKCLEHITANFTDRCPY